MYLHKIQKRTKTTSKLNLSSTVLNLNTTKKLYVKWANSNFKLKWWKKLQKLEILESQSKKFMSHKILQFKMKNKTSNMTERNKFKHQKLIKNQEIPIMVQGLHKRFLMRRLLKGLIIRRRLGLHLSFMLEVVEVLILALLKLLIQHLGKTLR
jgi:hypothetical protein